MTFKDIKPYLNKQRSKQIYFEVEEHWSGDPRELKKTVSKALWKAGVPVPLLHSNTVEAIMTHVERKAL